MDAGFLSPELQDEINLMEAEMEKAYKGLHDDEGSSLHKVIDGDEDITTMDHSFIDESARVDEEDVVISMKQEMEAEEEKMLDFVEHQQYLQNISPQQSPTSTEVDETATPTSHSEHELEDGLFGLGLQNSSLSMSADTSEGRRNWHGCITSAIRKAKTCAERVRLWLEACLVLFSFYYPR